MLKSGKSWANLDTWVTLVSIPIHLSLSLQHGQSCSHPSAKDLLKDSAGQMSRTATRSFISALFAIPPNPELSSLGSFLSHLEWICSFFSHLASAHFPLGFLMNIEINLASPLVHSTLRTVTSCSSCQHWRSHGH